MKLITHGSKKINAKSKFKNLKPQSPTITRQNIEYYWDKTIDFQQLLQECFKVFIDRKTLYSFKKQ